MVSKSLSFDCSIEWTVSEAGVNLGAADKGEGNGFEKMCSIYCVALEHAINMSLGSCVVL